MKLLPSLSLPDGRDLGLEALSAMGAPTFLPGDGPWELEIGFGKGRYLLRRAADHPTHRFLGIEVVAKYQRMVAHRARRRGIRNLAVLRGEALYLLAAFLPRGFAQTLHIYFPDPWPKARHQKRRLFDPRSVDLVLGALCPGGELYFATDYLEYGESVVELLSGFPDLRIERLQEPWPDGARTNYEAKYMREGRPILRLIGHLAADSQPGSLHPQGRAGILAAVMPRDRD